MKLVDNLHLSVPVPVIPDNTHRFPLLSLSFDSWIVYLVCIILLLQRAVSDILEKNVCKILLRILNIMFHYSNSFFFFQVC